MSPDRIQQIKELYHAVCENRAALDQADPELRREVRRMLDPNHDTRQEKIQAAIEALGKRVVMAYDDAA